jgi:hypothetical protein
MNAAPRARLQALVEQAKAWLVGRSKPCEAFKRQSDSLDPYRNPFICTWCGCAEEAHILQALAACLAAEGEEDMSVQVADYEIALQRAAAIILKLRGCAEDEIDDQLIASLVDHELREPPAPPVASPASPEGA